MTDEEKRILWELLTRILDDDDPGVRRVGLLIHHLTIVEGRRWVRLSYAEIEEEAGLTPRRARPRLEYMQRKELIERRTAHGRPGARREDPRGNYYRLAVPDGGHEEPEEDTAPARAGPTKKRPEGVTSSPEPQDVSAPPSGRPEPDNQMQS